MAFKCLQTEELLTAALSGRASEAERLLLEEHLEGCAACRETRAAFEPLRRTRRWEPDLSDAGRGRVLRALLLAAAAPEAREPARSAWGGWGTVAVAAVFAFAILGLFVPAWRRAAVPEAVVPRDPVAAANARDRMRPGPDGKVTLEGAVVELAPDTEALWRAASRTIELRRGAVVVEVSPNTLRGLRVTTPSFSTKVLGTRFRVDLGGVATESGLVRVFAADDRLLAEVGPGQRWREVGSAGPRTATSPRPRVEDRQREPRPSPRSRPADRTGRKGSRG
ncbi:MAG: FecR domain-containing protein [Deltaproteobacteria bacterium]|nr:FecR domain-containing protein [Deltaproteobacteria bacterium]